MSSSSTSISSIKGSANNIPHMRRMKPSVAVTLCHRTKPKTKKLAVEIVDPVKAYMMHQLEEAHAHHVAWLASGPQREAAEKKRLEAEALEKKKADMKSAKRESVRAKKQQEQEARLANLHAAHAQQKLDGVSYTLTVAGCAKFVRPDEMCFFQDHHIPRSYGSITCFTCSRDKQAKLRHDPAMPIGEVFPCFMCSQPVGWVYYCPDCSWKNK
jgi:hypothetical protein